jgi:hypothetical protein
MMGSAEKLLWYNYIPLVVLENLRLLRTTQEEFDFLIDMKIKVEIMYFIRSPQDFLWLHLFQDYTKHHLKEFNCYFSFSNCQMNSDGFIQSKHNFTFL